MAGLLTEKEVGAKWRGKDTRISEGASRGAGRLVAMLREGGATFYFQYFPTKGVKRYLPIGAHDSTGKRGVSLKEARDRAAKLSALYRSGIVDLHEHFARENASKAAEFREAEETKRRAEVEARSATLRELLDAYARHLARNGKESAAQVASIFKKNVYEAAPELAERRAASISVDEFVGLIGRLVEDGKGRTASKLRSYLRAAFGLALRAKTDPSAPLSLRAFKIETNPIASVAAMPQFSRTRDRNLSADELRILLARLDPIATVERDAVMLGLLLGGQRTTQLLRARPADVDLEAGTLLLLDGKGRRTEPRRHVLPLTRRTLGILEPRLAAQPDAEAPIFGRLRAEMVARLVSEISDEMVAAKEAKTPFELRDLRRTCETMLAALGVSSDIRAQIQSHGLGGIQARHYDRHSYALEKRAALAKWEKHLDAIAAGKVAAVIPHRRRVEA